MKSKPFQSADTTISPNRDILDILVLEPGLSLATFSVDRAHKALINEPWVKNASVRKVYPGKLSIIVDEREPFAVWLRGDAVSVIDRDGKELGTYNELHHGSLPKFYGHGAPEKSSDFHALLAQFPALHSRVHMALYRSQRRWDLLFDNEITVKLPEKDYEQSLALLNALDERNDLLSKDIESVDMRLADRLVMRLSDEAMINRLATIKKRREDAKRENRT